MPAPSVTAMKPIARPGNARPFARQPDARTIRRSLPKALPSSWNRPRDPDIAASFWSKIPAPQARGRQAPFCSVCQIIALALRRFRVIQALSAAWQVGSGALPPPLRAPPEYLGKCEIALRILRRQLRKFAERHVRAIGSRICTSSPERAFAAQELHQRAPIFRIGGASALPAAPWRDPKGQRRILANAPDQVVARGRRSSGPFGPASSTRRKSAITHRHG